MKKAAYGTAIPSAAKEKYPITSYHKQEGEFKWL